MFFAINEKAIRLWCAKRKRTIYLTLILLICSYIFAFESVFSSGPLLILAFDLTALVSLALLVVVGEDNGGFKGFLIRPFAYLGRRTYGMYIFHWPVLALMVSKSIFFDTDTGVSLKGLFFAFSLVVVGSVFSYRFFEKPFLDLRKKYQYVKIG
jgi:peptidoglycan/LPS O-acetylase OafA/YrhL